LKLIASVKLETNPGTYAALEDTLRETNRCANWLSERAWETQTFSQFKLQKLAYVEARKRFSSLSSQIVIRAIAKVSDAYKLDQETKRTFRLDGSIAYDLRILR
jgi:putative transposase